jgi:hypothetical protein
LTSDCDDSDLRVTVANEVGSAAAGEAGFELEKTPVIHNPAAVAANAITTPTTISGRRRLDPLALGDIATDGTSSVLSKRLATVQPERPAPLLGSSESHA